MTCGADWADEQHDDPPDEPPPPAPPEPERFRLGRLITRLPDIANYQPTTNHRRST